MIGLLRRTYIFINKDAVGNFLVRFLSIAQTN